MVPYAAFGVYKQPPGRINNMEILIWIVHHMNAREVNVKNYSAHKHT